MEGKKETEHVSHYGELQGVISGFGLAGKFPSIPKSRYQVNFEEAPISQKLRN